MALQDPSGLAGATCRMATPGGVGARSTGPPAPPGWQFWEPDTEHPDAALAQAQPVHPYAGYDAAPAQPIGNWAARPRPNQGLGTALLVLEPWWC